MASRAGTPESSSAAWFHTDRTRPLRSRSKIAAGEAARTGEREAYFPEFGEKVATPVYSTTRLITGATITGQAIIESPNTTLVINPGDRLSVLEGGRLLIDVAAAA